MLKVYRVKTFYHLLVTLLILQEDENNLLYLDGADVIPLKEELILSNLFNEVRVNSVKNLPTWIRKSKTFLLGIYYQIFNRYYHKDRILIVSPHNIRGEIYFHFLRSNNIILIEDGLLNYYNKINNEINSLYTDYGKNFSIKFFLKNYFIHISNPFISQMIFTSRDRLKNNLPEIYKQIKSIILEVPIEETLKTISHEKKEKIKHIFNINELRINIENKSICILTQPLYEDNKYSLSEVREIVSIFDQYLSAFNISEYSFYIKAHPRENNSFYDSLIKKYKMKVIEKTFPFELLSLFSIEFDYGITYYSTAIYSKIFREKVMLKK